MNRAGLWLLGCVLLFGAGTPVRAADEADYTRQEDVIYGRKFGMALTLDIFKPKKETNGAAIIIVVSGGWFSSHEAINPEFTKEFLQRGYTVFCVTHGSQPRFTIPEAISDLNRAVRFIRFHAKDYQIDPERIGITGGSAGGHLSLMQGTAGDAGDPKAKDPIDQTSSRVQAVACFFPPTDFLNYGEKGTVALGRGPLDWLKAPFAFHDFDEEKKVFVPVTDEKKILEIGKQISPITHVSADSPPTLIIHGDADKVVPIQQAEVMLARLKEAGVPVELVVKKGSGHGWPDIGKDMATLADWFDKYLKKKE
jgi:acetyl esterase/lipase